MLNPVTGVQDDKTNKFVEAIIGFFAIKHGTNVELDDPVNSSNGTNPDVLFDYKGKRISFACKTLRSAKPSTVFGNLKSAAEQISRSVCDIGFILLNAMNIVDHDKVQDHVFANENAPLTILQTGLNKVYNGVSTDWEIDLTEIFEKYPKVSPVVITLLHSTARINSPIGALSTSLKATVLTNFNEKNVYTDEDIEIGTTLPSMGKGGG